MMFLPKLRYQIAFILVLGLAAGFALVSSGVSAAPPQFPNVFYGSVQVGGVDAPAGYYVTAVLDRGTDVERHYVLQVSPTGQYGSGNGLKLKVGGDLQGNIAHLAPLEFFVTAAPLGMGSTLTPAGHAVFYADYMPHVTRLALAQN